MGLPMLYTSSTIELSAEGLALDRGINSKRNTHPQETPFSVRSFGEMRGISQFLGRAPRCTEGDRRDRKSKNGGGGGGGGGGRGGGGGGGGGVQWWVHDRAGVKRGRNGCSLRVTCAPKTGLGRIALTPRIKSAIVSHQPNARSAPALAGQEKKKKRGKRARRV